MSVTKTKLKLLVWWVFSSIILAGSFIFPVSASNNFIALFNGIGFVIVSFYCLRFVYRKIIFKLIFGYKWSKGRGEYIKSDL